MLTRSQLIEALSPPDRKQFLKNLMDEAKRRGNEAFSKIKKLIVNPAILELLDLDKESITAIKLAPRENFAGVFATFLLTSPPPSTADDPDKKGPTTD
jgi:hypothetical protein